ncbi:hypothetical protein COCNU_02G008680 [Cocos nucifera]|uniref:Uncharacterized protein n=1 Tax=Cocos nucifera TaxID=13894 RepID=A0A8K0HYP5_COCNU|nr:hypothetical protein COCNU_02G008680 [Cocos nucifera]
MSRRKRITSGSCVRSKVEEDVTVGVIREKSMVKERGWKKRACEKKSREKRRRRKRVGRARVRSEKASDGERWRRVIVTVLSPKEEDGDVSIGIEEELGRGMEWGGTEVPTAQVVSGYNGDIGEEGEKGVARTYTII